MKAENKIVFENGIGHTFTEEEIIVIKRLLHSAEVDEEYQEALENLKSLFLEHLD
jgi:hypothetical protein